MSFLKYLSIQFKKTIAQPSRLILIPLIILNNRAPWMAQLLFRIMLLLGPKAARDAIKADFLYVKADALFKKNKNKEAWNVFRKCLEISENPYHFFVAGACLLKGLGRFKDFIICQSRANELRSERASVLGVANVSYRVLDNFWTGHFGHIADMDYVIKLGILEGRKPEDTILYLPPVSQVANSFLLEQWRPLIRIVQRPEDLPIPEDAVDALQFQYLAPRHEGKTVHYWELAARTYRRWYADGRRPLLTIAPEIEDRGWQALESVGVPHNAWFVALHVREAGSNPYFQDGLNALNADIQKYMPAIAEITRRGGWVIRLGDPSMAELPAMPGVFDYCHSKLRVNWMDVFIAAKCQFLLGTSSGPAYVPPAYGVPVVLTNWWPPSQRPWHPNDIFIPKLYRKSLNSHYLNIKEMLTEPFAYCTSVADLTSDHDVLIEDNDPEDIRLAVVEMFERLDGTISYTELDLKLRKQAEQLYEDGASYGMALLARDFLRRHNFLLD